MNYSKLLLATRNLDKISEIKQLLNDLNIEIISALDIPGLENVIEDQDTLEGNATKKAKILQNSTGFPSVADDTGLEVFALKGQPGVYSSRYAGENCTYDDNVNKILKTMQGIPEQERDAQFRTVVAFAMDDDIKLFEGVCKGKILDEKKGTNGFGYDPIFWVPEIGKTFAEMRLEEKNSISHRGKAFRAFNNFLRGVAQSG